MSNYINVQGVSKRVADATLFENLQFGLQKGQKTALIGSNGSGKTTLLNIVAKREEPDEGQVVWRNDIEVGMLPQEPQFAFGATVMDAVYEAQSEEVQAVREYEDLLAHPEDSEAYQERFQRALDRMESLKAWNREERAKEVLAKLGIEEFDKPVEELSGGQRKRVALAALLIQSPDVLILDEPTNHLDLPMVEWLEGELARDSVTLLMVTHDRYFLDRVTQDILELSRQQLFHYEGNYRYFLEKKAEREANEAAAQHRAQQLMKKELDWIRRQPKARGTKAKARVEAFEDIKEQARPVQSEAELNPHMRSRRLGSKVVELKSASKAFEGKTILDKFEYRFAKGERIGITGRNGTGKTTFLNLLIGEESPDAGKIVHGETVVMGYYRQQFVHFPEGKRVIDAVKDIAEDFQVSGNESLSPGQLLQRFLFEPKRQYGLIEKLSGGERRRLALLMELAKQPNFLILDEPTNDLDITSLQVLEDYLQDFPGCLVVVSHDRYFMDRLVDHLFVFEGEGRIRDFPGNYTQYREQREREEQQQREAASDKRGSKHDKPSKSAASRPKADSGKKLSSKEQKEYSELDREIARLEERKAELTRQMNTGELEGEKLQAAGEEYARIDREVESLTERWMELAEKME
jgi:ATP-binding cassette subfamily F protein uup